ncbi:MAG TPA: class I SAM-dependent methyltransferase [Stellaceae bacterium]|nr:class I SAM-dependent methyltransferase [Stellaceae bacterium]
MPVNAQYSIVRPGSIASEISALQRRKMFAAFLRSFTIADTDTILDVGATSDRSYDHSNYVEAWYERKSALTAVGIDDAGFLVAEYPGLVFVRADGRRLPFKDGSFDFVHSSAVIEHVGSFESQCAFLKELWRVARKGIFVTTPNRWYPVEFHTVLPLLHWLPKRIYRRILVGLGHGFFATEENLNLMSRGTLSKAASSAGAGRFSIKSVALVGLPTNLLLVAHKC